MKGAVLLDRSFRHDELPRLRVSQPRHVDLLKNALRYVIADGHEYTPVFAQG
jgi:hypothetical protein